MFGRSRNIKDENQLPKQDNQNHSQTNEFLGRLIEISTKQKQDIAVLQNEVKQQQGQIESQRQLLHKQQQIIYQLEKELQTLFKLVGDTLTNRQSSIESPKKQEIDHSINRHNLFQPQAKQIAVKQRAAPGVMGQAEHESSIELKI